MRDLRQHWTWLATWAAHGVPSGVETPIPLCGIFPNIEEWEAQEVEEALARGFKNYVSFYDEPTLASGAPEAPAWRLRPYCYMGEGHEGAPQWFHLQNGTNREKKKTDGCKKARVIESPIWC